MASTVEHDKPNILYVHIGEWVSRLASIGATDAELIKLFYKGGAANLSDIATIEARHTHYTRGGGR